MDTENLIRTLAADHGSRARSVKLVLAMTLAIALPFTAMMFFMRLGLRSDFSAALGSPFFVLKFIVTLALVFVSLALAVRLARPGAPVLATRWLLAIPLGMLFAGIAADLLASQTIPWTARLVGTNSRVCLTAIPLLSMPLLIAALVGLRQGAATRPALTGAIAGLVAGGVAATLYAAHCIDDSPLFVATWYSLALAFVAAIGAVAGKWLLKF